MKIFEVYEAGKTERSVSEGETPALRLSIKYARALHKPGLFIKVYRFEVRCALLLSVASAGGRFACNYASAEAQKKGGAAPSPSALNETTAFILQLKCSFARNFCPRHAPCTHTYAHGGSSEMPPVCVLAQERKCLGFVCLDKRSSRSLCTPKYA